MRAPAAIRRRSREPACSTATAFHAGNFADVHKHVALLALLAALQKKAKGFLYVDTHAGSGLYDLAGAEARRSAESEAGIGRLQSAAARTRRDRSTISTASVGCARR